jgi:hypothetical protein
MKTKIIFNLFFTIMKPLFTPTLLLSLLALAGCNNTDDTTIDESASQQLIFSASLPDDEDTRMAFANETSPTLIWSEGDQITVFSTLVVKDSSPSQLVKGAYKRCAMTSGAGTVNAEFLGGAVKDWYPDNGSYEYYYFYGVYTGLEPDAFTEAELSGTYKVSYTLPSSQAGDLSSQICIAKTPAKMSSGRYDSSSTKFSLSFTPSTALVRLRLKLSDDYTSDEMTISSAKITSNTWKTYLAGACSFNLASTTLSHSDADSQTITVDKEFTLKKGTYTDIYFSTLPTGTSTDITISLTSSDGTVKLYKDSAENNSFSAKITGGTRYTVKRDVK